MIKILKGTISKIKNIFFHRGISIFLLRIFLGLMFVYASIHKINNPVDFSQIIAKYEILPFWAINITAIILPWLELWIGILLIMGIFVRSCAIIQCGLLVVFILSIGFNIVRGLDFYCGCFPEDNIFSGTNYLHITLNIFWLLMAILLFMLERRRFSHRFLMLLFSKKTDV
ncbi:MAG: MauE/DoxX family redox-associated membrane protein [Nitrospirota bacterium]